jgi:hypothetical protein
VTSNPGRKCRCFWVKHTRRWTMARLTFEYGNGVFRPAGIAVDHS